MNKPVSWHRWLAGIVGVGVLFQTGPCNLDAESQLAITNQLILPQLVNLISDTVFFVLDNALVRLSA